VGPELSSLAQKGADYLLTNILDPNLEVNPQFLNYVVLLHDGRTTSGMIVDESAASLTVQRADKERQSLLRSEIDQLRNTGRSLMPEGLEQSLSPQDMTDLLQYLMNVR
jgi:putative heme-binding domain-containing protein